MFALLVSLKTEEKTTGKYKPQVEKLKVRGKNNEGYLVGTVLWKE